MLTWKQARRVVVAVLGGSVLLVGLALVVLPGPAFIVIPIGLAILATEFVWARRWLAKIKASAGSVAQSIRKPDQ
jgi:tellurite resistance protein TerC